MLSFIILVYNVLTQTTNMFLYFPLACFTTEKLDWEHQANAKWAIIARRVFCHCSATGKRLKHEAQGAAGVKFSMTWHQGLHRVPAQLSSRRFIPSCSQLATSDQSITTTARPTRTQRCELSMQHWQECKSFTHHNRSSQACTTWLEQFGYKWRKTPNILNFFTFLLVCPFFS